MRLKRKKIKRSRVKFFKSKLEEERVLRAEASKKVTLYHKMSRSFWERWRWELQQRKEVMKREKVLLSGVNGVKTRQALKIHEIDPQVLANPPHLLDDQLTYIGRGSFSVVKVQVYRGFKVAVKEYLPHSLAFDVRREARVLSMLCHPYLPLLFGVITSVRPFRLIMQYHALDGKDKSITLDSVIRHPLVSITDKVMVLFCVQIMEALRYLHDDVSLLHNDLKCNNILVCDDMSSHHQAFQIIVIDFGKATSVDGGRTFSLTESDKAEHYSLYAHIPPEVIEGVSSQTTMSDIYSAGCIIKCVSNNSIRHDDVKLALNVVVMKCCSSEFCSRPKAQEVLDLLKQIKLCE